MARCLFSGRNAGVFEITTIITKQYNVFVVVEASSPSPLFSMNSSQAIPLWDMAHL